MTNLVARTVGFLTEIQTGGFSNTSSKRYALETVCHQRDETIFYCNIFDTPQRNLAIVFFCRILLDALKASVVNNNCFEE